MHPTIIKLCILQTHTNNANPQHTLPTGTYKNPVIRLMSMGLQYTRSMRAILDWFNSERCDCATVGYITDEVDYSRETVRQGLKELAASDAAELRHEPTALYRLRYDPRDTEVADDE